jgi:hypothetical protein
MARTSAASSSAVRGNMVPMNWYYWLAFGVGVWIIASLVTVLAVGRLAARQDRPPATRSGSSHRQAVEQDLAIGVSAEPRP